MLIVETGGTVGDIESQPFLEAIRQLRLEVGANGAIIIHLVLVPYVASAGETKTKPTQHSVKELRSIGLQPDVLVCRSEKALARSAREKIALFTNVEERAVVSFPDLETINQAPEAMHAQGMDDIVVERLGLNCPAPDLASWSVVVDAELNPDRETRIAIVGKYLDLLDAYKSLVEAVAHAGIQTRTRVVIDYIDAQELEDQGTDRLADVHAILVPGGFGQRGFEGKILAARYAREHGVPYFGICYGLHAAFVDFARNVLSLEGAHSTEIDATTPHPVIGLITEWTGPEGRTERRTEQDDLGGTMRLGEQKCQLAPDSLAARLYRSDVAAERHRHRYEVNNHYVAELEKRGMIISGRSEDGELVEMIELADHPWFVACQFHPEFTSSPRSGHPLFTGIHRSGAGARAVGIGCGPERRHVELAFHHVAHRIRSR